MPHKDGQATGLEVRAHYAYISRSGNEILAEFKRFDDDRRSAIHGEDVWSSLVVRARATWPRIAVTPMIGQNDQADEVFTLADTQQLEAFAAGKHLAWLSMWSAARDQECPGGANRNAQPACSSVVQSADAFMKAMGAY